MCFCVPVFECVCISMLAFVLMCVCVCVCSCVCVFSHVFVCVDSQEARCGYAIILMALYWCTECIPLAMTALLPVILFPMMGIMTSGAVCNLPTVHQRVHVLYLI